MEGKQIDDLIVEDLDVLLGWHGVAIRLLKNKASKVVQWKAIASSMKKPPILTRWMDKDEANLKLLLSDDVDIKDTQYVHLVALKE